VKNKNLEFLLAKQRYALVTMYVRTDTKHKPDDNQINKILLTKYNQSLIYAFDSKLKTGDKLVKELTDIQNFFFTKFIKNEINYDYIDSLKTEQLYEYIIARNSKFSSLLYDRLMFDFLFAKKYTDEQFFEQLQKLGHFTKKDPGAQDKRMLDKILFDKVLYNNQLYLLKNANENKAKIASDVVMSLAKEESDKSDYQVKYYHPEEFIFLDKIQQFVNVSKNMKTDKAKLDSLNLFYLFNRIEKLFLDNYFFHREEINGLVQTVYKTFVKDAKQLSDSNRIMYAKYFTAFEQLEWSKQLLEPIASGAKPNIEAYTYLLKIKLYQADKTETFIKLLADAQKVLGKKSWCQLFSGTDHINFQVMDIGQLHYMYCKNCGCK